MVPYFRKLPDLPAQAFLRRSTEQRLTESMEVCKLGRVPA